MPFNRLLCKSCHSGRDLTVNRYIGYAHFLHGGDQRPGLPRVAVQEAFALEGVDVLHHRCLAREAEMMLDFARAGRDPFFALLGLDKFQDASLSLREHAL